MIDARLTQQADAISGHGEYGRIFLEFRCAPAKHWHMRKACQDVIPRDLVTQFGRDPALSDDQCILAGQKSGNIARTTYGNDSDIVASDVTPERIATINIERNFSSRLGKGTRKPAGIDFAAPHGLLQVDLVDPDHRCAGS